MTSHDDKRRELGWDVELPLADDLPDNVRDDVREAVAEINAMQAASTPVRGFGWLDNLVTRSAVHGAWLRRAWVDRDPAKMRSLRNSTILRSIAAVFCWGTLAVSTWRNDVWLSALPVRGLIYGIALGHLVLWSLNTARCYKSGWIDGRESMRRSAREAWARGMPIEEWWEREQRRDWGIL